MADRRSTRFPLAPIAAIAAINPTTAPADHDQPNACAVSAPRPVATALLTMAPAIAMSEVTRNRSDADTLEHGLGLFGLGGRRRIDLFPDVVWVESADVLV